MSEPYYGSMITGERDITGQIEALKAENDRLWQTLEKIAKANWLDDPHEARRIAKAELAKKAEK